MYSAYRMQSYKDDICLYLNLQPNVWYIHLPLHYLYIATSVSMVEKHYIFLLLSATYPMTCEMAKAQKISSLT